MRTHLPSGFWQRKRQKSSKFNEKNNNAARASRFLYISLPSLHNYNVTWNFELTWEREPQSDKFYFLYLKSDAVSPLQFQPNASPFQWLGDLV